MYLSDLKKDTPASICISTSKSKHTFECVIVEKAEDDALLSLAVTDSVSLLNAVLEDFSQCDVILQDENRSKPICVFTDVTLGITSTTAECVILTIYDDTIGEFTDRRAWPRYELDWKGVIVSSTHSITAQFQLHDVSKYGLGLDVPVYIPTHDICSITLKNQVNGNVLNFKAQVLHKNLVSPGIYRYGLAVVGDDFDLMPVIRLIEGSD